MLIGQRQRQALAVAPSDRGVHAPALDIDEVPETLRPLIETDNPGRVRRIQRLAQIKAVALVRPRSEFGGDGPVARPIGLFRHAVDHPATAAASKDHRVGALQHLDPLGVVKIAEILDVVADAIDEEVGGAGVAPDGRRIAVTLALAHADPRHIAHHIGHPLHRLIADQLVGDHRDRLGNVAQRRVGPGRSEGPFGAIGRVARRGNHHRQDAGGLHIVVGRPGGRDAQQEQDRGEGDDGRCAAGKHGGSGNFCD